MKIQELSYEAYHLPVSLSSKWAMVALRLWTKNKEKFVLCFHGRKALRVGVEGEEGFSPMTVRRMACEVRGET